MAVIKANEFRQVDVQHVPYNFEDLSQRAKAYLDDVRAQAKAILDQAQQESEQIRQKAEAEALATAERTIQQRVELQAKQLVKQQIESSLPALQQAVHTVCEARNAWLARWEQQAIELAVAIAAKLVRGELSRQPEIPLRLIKESLELAAGSPQLRLRLHPADHATLSNSARELAAQVAPLAELELVADAKIPQGSCLLETEHGHVDQTWEAQLRRIEEELTL
jgi:type III secretion protein L